MGIEIKSGTEWRRTSGSVLKNLMHEKVLTGARGVYLGDHVLSDGPITVLPVRDFMRKLGDNEIIA